MNKKNSIGLDPERPENFEVKAEEIIRRLKDTKNSEHPKICHYFFFYGCKDPYTSKMLPMPSWYEKYSDMPNIAPLRSSLLNYLNQNCHVVMSDEYFSTIVYETLMSDGSWNTLRTYEKQSSFFAWLKEVAKNAVLDRLKNEKYIPITHSRTPGNTRLALRSKPVEMLQLVIDEQLEGSKYHGLMYSSYVSGLNKEELMVKYHMTEQELKEAQEEGERELKEALLRTSCWYEKEVLHDKNRAELTVSLEFVADMEAWLTAEMNDSTLADVFGICLTDGEVQEKVVDFLYDFSAKLNWKDRDRNLWRQRFINDASPIVLANSMNKSRAWVDTRYSQLNKKFQKAIKEWWETYAE